MYRSHTCGELRLADAGKKVTLSGWVARTRDKGAMMFIDLRDRYGITQLYFSPLLNKELYDASKGLGREFVIAVDGTVNERESKNPQLPTGDIEIIVTELRILNTSKTPPFTIEDNTDGGDDLRMRYRYLDLRRNPVQQNLFFRSQVALETRKYLAAQGFIEVETPVLIKSTPEGARDFVVPSRLNPGQFYALPQSPQTFKQLLMVSGFDRYFQIVKCFRDEDLRADRQPEFTQIDCEMAFVHQEDILQMFEGLSRELFRNCIGVELPEFPRMKYDEAMERYGSDKPDLRFDMQIHDLTNLTKGKGFPVFDNAEYIGAINTSGTAGYTRKQIDEITEWVKRPQIGASGLVWAKYEEDGNCKSSVDKFYSPDDIKSWLMTLGAKPGDMILLLCGEWEKTHKQLGDLRLHMADQLGIRQTGEFKPLWVVDFPLLEWDEASGRFFAMHHPFTSPKKEFIEDMKSNDKVKLSNLRADAYDMVINGVEIGGGSIRIHDHDLQSLNFDLLGFTKEEAEAQFGFLLGAFEYGAPPHGGLAFGFDRLCAVMQGTNTIRDFIAFPKNNQGRDVMLDAPSPIKDEQLKELYLNVIPNS